MKFQSTRPVRGGTPEMRVCKRCGMISIHPPRAGRDRVDVRIYVCGGDFNPPAPCGAGRQPAAGGPLRREFQSTRPVRGGTMNLVRFRRDEDDFNPPAPCGVGQSKGWMVGKTPIFQSTRPVRGGTSRFPISV